MAADDFDTLVAAARAGGGWAFERLYNELAGAVTSYLHGQGAEDPEGMTNEVFLRVFRSIARFEGDGRRFRSWVFSIAHNQLIDDRRRRSRRPRTAGTEIGDVEANRPGVPSAEASALVALGHDQVLALLDGLAPDQRSVLLLRLVADLTVEQVGEVLGKRAGAVKALQRRGLEALRRTIEREGVTL